ncbi:MAG: hypothetical protein PVJ73_19955, partial [Acidobacteriota bacterium]
MATPRRWRLVVTLAVGVGLLSPAPARAAGFVKSVEYVELPFGQLDLASSANLTKGQDIAQCVPFASLASGTGNDEDFDRTFTDIFFQAGPARVTAQRGYTGSSAQLTVGVYVVEFDPAFVRVQSGAWSMAYNTTSSTAGLGTAVDLGKAALVSYYRIGELASSANRIWRRVAVSGRFSSTSQLTWERFESATDVTAVINGHYYVFEALTSEFSVQARSFQVATGASSGSATLSPPVDLAKSFVIASYRTEYDDDQPQDGIVGVYLSAGDTLTAEQLYDNSSAIDQFWIQAFVVSFATIDNGGVQRGTLAYPALTATATATVNPVNLNTATVWNGVAMPGPGVMQNASNSSGAVDSAFQKLTMTNSVTVSGARIDTSDVATGRFEVIDWGPSTCCALEAVEGADTITVTAPDQFKMIFSTLAGGGIEELYDLAEDPSGTLDIAGADPASTSSAALHNFGISQASVPATYYNSGSDSSGGARVHLLEATSARVRVRQDAFYHDAVGGTSLGGVKGYGDYSIYGAGKVGLHWERRVSAPAGIAYDSEYKELMLHYLDVPSSLNGWTLYDDAGTPPASGLSHFALAQNETLGTPPATTDVLDILHEDWDTLTGHFGTADSMGRNFMLSAERVNIWWGEFTGGTLPDGRRDFWDSLTYIKPTTFVDHADAAVTVRSTDYRAPDDPNTTLGSPWNDPDENTASDKFNEAEGAYLFTLDPTNGLRFTMDGTTTTRFAPFFKIRQWRSLAPPWTITFDPDSGGAQPAVTLTRDVDYRADVKPVSRAHFAQELRWHSTLQANAAVTSPDVGAAGQVVGAPAFAAARYGNGVSITANTQYVALPTSDFDAALGALEFWFRPAFDSADSVHHDLCGFSDGSGHVFVLEKAATDNLNFVILVGGTVSQLRVLPVDYSWRAGDWVHLRLEWDDTLPLATQLRLFLNGVEPVHSDPVAGYISAGLTVQPLLRFGTIDADLTFAPGIFDEIRLYGGSSTTPAPLAHGGLTTDASEYLA